MGLCRSAVAPGDRTLGVCMCVCVFFCVCVCVHVCVCVCVCVCVHALFLHEKIVEVMCFIVSVSVFVFAVHSHIRAAQKKNLRWLYFTVCVERKEEHSDVSGRKFAMLLLFVFISLFCCLDPLKLNVSSGFSCFIGKRVGEKKASEKCPSLFQMSDLIGWLVAFLGILQLLFKGLSLVSDLRCCCQYLVQRSHQTLAN